MPPPDFYQMNQDLAAAHKEQAIKYQAMKDAEVAYQAAKDSAHEFHEILLDKRQLYLNFVTHDFDQQEGYVRMSKETVQAYTDACDAKAAYMRIVTTYLTPASRTFDDARYAYLTARDTTNLLKQQFDDAWNAQDQIGYSEDDLNNYLPAIMDDFDFDETWRDAYSIPEDGGDMPQTMVDATV
jgi:hypothetical protein